MFLNSFRLLFIKHNTTFSAKRNKKIWTIFANPFRYKKITKRYVVKNKNLFLLGQKNFVLFKKLSSLSSVCNHLSVCHWCWYKNIHFFAKSQSPPRANDNEKKVKLLQTGLQQNITTQIPNKISGPQQDTHLTGRRKKSK